MATNTFEAIATTVVSGSSTTEVTFSGLNTSTYKNFIIIGSCRAVGTGNAPAIRVNGITSGSYYYTILTCQSQQTAFGAVPQGGINNSTSIRLSDYTSTANTGSNFVFRSTITNPIGGQTNILSEVLNFNASNNTTSWHFNNGYINAALTSISIVVVGAGAFGDTSTFSIYGLV
jgi:hypothetical protein